MLKEDGGWFKVDMSSKELLETYFSISEEETDYLLNYFNMIGLVKICSKDGE